LAMSWRRATSAPTAKPAPSEHEIRKAYLKV
jgi:hypothetical protein